MISVSFPVSHINRRIELLTGKEAGEPDENGRVPEDPLTGLLLDRLNKVRGNQQKSGDDHDEHSDGNLEKLGRDCIWKSANNKAPRGTCSGAHRRFTDELMPALELPQTCRQRGAGHPWGCYVRN